MAKKGKITKKQSEQVMDRVEDEKQKTDPPQVEESAPKLETASIPPADVASLQQTAPQPTETSTQSTKTRTSGGTRSVCAMHKVVIKKARGEKFKDTFEVTPESQKRILQSTGAKWRNFKAKLTAEHVLPYIGQKKKLSKPPKKYAFVGRLEPDEVPDRAILWKKARVPKHSVIDPKLAKLHQKIDDLLEKQRKGEFKPQGTNDVLTTVLETPEHFAGVESFDCCEQYSFTNIVRQSKLSRGKRRRTGTTEECEEKKEIAKKLMVDELMVDDAKQDENCFAIDPPPPPPEQKGPRKCEMAVDSIDNKVAFGVAFQEGDEMRPLQPGFVRVAVDGSIKDDALVPKKKKPQSEVQRVHALFNSVKPKEDVPPRFRVLYKFAKTVMKESGNSIPVPCDVDIFGIERTIYLLDESVLSLLEFKMIGQAVISTYMTYLYSMFRDTPGRDLSTSFSFLHPSAYNLNDEFEAYVVQRLKDGVLQMNFLPFNYSSHWILIVIWESEIYLLNSLPHYPHPEQLEKALKRAVRSYNAQEGRVNKNPKIKKLVGCPKQPGGMECGYAVMRYMKDIIEDTDMKLLEKWACKSRRSYTMEELDVVRLETLDYIESIM
ncbi:hypothetical protein ACET3Z_010320 [Daucus carota]